MIPAIVVPTGAVGKRPPQHPPLRLMSTRSVTPLANPIGDQALLRNLPLLEKNHISSRRGIFVAIVFVPNYRRALFRSHSDVINPDKLLTYF